VPFLFADRYSARFGGPDNFDGLPQRGRNVSQSEVPCGWIARIRYLGYVEDEDDVSNDPTSIYDWEIEFDFSEERIESHPRIQELMDWFAGSYEDDRVVFAPTIDKNGASLYKAARGSSNRVAGVQRRGRIAGRAGVAKSFIEEGGPNPMHGRESYFVSAATCRITRILYNVPKDIYTRVNKIVDRPPIPEIKNVEWTSNWLYMQPTITRLGPGVQRIVENLKLGPPGGWIKEVQEFLIVK